MILLKIFNSIIWILTKPKGKLPLRFCLDYNKEMSRKTVTNLNFKRLTCEIGKEVSGTGGGEVVSNLFYEGIFLCDEYC